MVREVGLAEELAQDALVIALAGTRVEFERAAGPTRNEREKAILLARAAARGVVPISAPTRAAGPNGPQPPAHIARPRAPNGCRA